MKQILLFLILILTIFISSSCDKCKESGTTHECDNNDSKRVGCMCNDGTQSTATGSGACSGHGGVDYWLCNDCK